MQNFTDAQRQHVPASIMAVLYNSEPEPEPEPEQEEETIESYVQKQEPWEAWRESKSMGLHSLLFFQKFPEL